MHTITPFRQQAFDNFKKPSSKLQSAIFEIDLIRILTPFNAHDKKDIVYQMYLHMFQENVS